ncbi:MAG: Ig-like domain-containing protein, partial [Ghiorsea sp.]|nr:Ig-like domain-containing protein [Ghiorsea sp.]
MTRTHIFHKGLAYIKYKRMCSICLKFIAILMCWMPLHVTAGNTTTLAGQASIDVYGYYTGGFLDGYSNVAQFNLPSDVITDGAGNFYIADTLNHRVRKIDALGNVTTIAGTGVAGDVPAAITPLITAPALTAQFNEPSGLALDGLGNLYVADSMNHCIRKITPLGVVSTYAGKGPTKPGFADALTPDLAKFLNPSGLAFDNNGNLYVADTWNNLIRKITVVGGVAGAVSTYAGEVLGVAPALSAPPGAFLDGLPTVARFNSPSDITFDAAGNLYVADTNNQRIRKIAVGVAGLAGVVSTIAGNAVVPDPSGNYAGGFADGNALTQALFSWPQGIGVDSSGNVLVSDTINNRIRVINPITGLVTTTGGAMGTGGFADGWTETSLFWNPIGITVGANGQGYVADTWNQRIRMIDLVDINNTAPVPTAPNISIQSGEVGQSQVSANDADIPANTISYAISTAPSNGTATITNLGLVTYTPNTNYFGKDSITIAVRDQYEATGLVTIDVTIAFATVSQGVSSSSSCITGTSKNSELIWLMLLTMTAFLVRAYN